MKRTSIHFPVGENHLTIPGPAGALEAIFTKPEENELSQPIVAVVCHPHSLQGGTMQNKVVTTLVRMFRDLHIGSVRFNFRGVGQSAGHYDAGQGETEDVLAVLRYLKEHFPDTSFYLAGFSFGAYVSFQAALRWPIQQLISIAPPVNHFDFGVLDLPTCPWVIVQGEEDEVVPAPEVFDWVAALPRQLDLIRMPDTGHFFHGKLVELKRVLRDIILAHQLLGRNNQ